MHTTLCNYNQANLKIHIIKLEVLTFKYIWIFASLKT